MGEDDRDEKIIDVDVGAVIDEYLDEEERPRKLGVYFPSEIGACLRRSYYGYLSPKPADATARRIFALGNNLHAFIAEALKASSAFSLVEDETPIRIDYKDEDSPFSIFGRIDDYVVTHSGKKIIIEAKTVSDVSKVEKPEDKHVMQVMLYLNAKEADYGLLVYLDKKNMRIRQFRVDYDDAAHNKVMDRFKDLDIHLRNKKLPPAEYYFNDEKVWECKYCPYYNECMKAIIESQ